MPSGPYVRDAVILGAAVGFFGVAFGVLADLRRQRNSGDLVAAAEIARVTGHPCGNDFGVPRGDDYEVEDLLSGARWTWNQDNFVRLDAFVEPVHILHVKGTR